MTSKFQNFINSTMKQFERFSKACNEGKLDLAKDIYQTYGHLIRIEKYYSSGELFLEICLEGDLDTAKWLLSVAEVKVPRTIYEALDTAVMFGRLTFVSWLLSELKLINARYLQQEGCNVRQERLESAYKFACCNHMRLDIVNYFRLVLFGEIDLEKCEKVAFDIAMKNGCLSIVKFITILNPNMKKYYNANFVLACGKGHLDIVEYLHTEIHYKPALVDGFTESCKKGHLDISQWLLPMVVPLLGLKHGQYNEYSHYIEVNYIFSETCETGQLEVAKWLYEIFNDIDLLFMNGKSSNYVFSLATINAQFLEMAEWLQSLNPYLFTLSYQSGIISGYKINLEKEMKWRQRKYPLWLASDESPNQKCLLYRIPEDVSRYIISIYL